MYQELLEKLRSLNSVLKESRLNDDFLKVICVQLSHVLKSNVYLFDDRGTIVSYSTNEKYYCQFNNDALKAYSVPENYLSLAKKTKNPIINIYTESPLCTYPGVDKCIYKNRYTSIIPIYYNYKKIAAILLIKYDNSFSQEDQIICEHAFAIISLEMIKNEIIEIKKDALNIASAQIAANALTYTEAKVAKEIFNKIENREAIINANEVSNELFVTRSIISNALNKIESAGVIVTKSLGVKGTYIKILNTHILEELDKINN